MLLISSLFFLFVIKIQNYLIIVFPSQKNSQTSSMCWPHIMVVPTPFFHFEASKYPDSDFRIKFFQIYCFYYKIWKSKRKKLFRDRIYLMKISIQRRILPRLRNSAMKLRDSKKECSMLAFSGTISGLSWLTCEPQNE